MASITQHLKDEERRQFLDRQPTYWMKRSYQALRRRVDLELRPHGITLSQRDALLTLRHAGPASHRDLEERLGLEQSSISRLVDGLERRGLVQIRTGHEDRRARVVSLTDAGQALLQSTPGASGMAGGRIAQALTPSEVDELIALLRRCTDVLENDEPVSMNPENPKPSHNMTTLSKVI